MIKKLADIWNKQWKTWKKPYNTELYRWPGSGWFRNIIGDYWYFDIIQKAGSTKPEKVISTWEGDTFTQFDLDIYMRPDDHQAIMERPVAVAEFPNMWDQPNNAQAGHPVWIPAKYCMPTFDEKLKGRVKK